MSDFWVFGYGSLIWRPGFEFKSEQPAVLHGRRRALCIHSWIHRGTRDRPGLVLGLDRGGSCRGVARLVDAEKRAAVIAYLRERELVTHVYKEKWLNVRLDDGAKVAALTYVVNRNHEQYAGAMDPKIVAVKVLNAEGISGPNREYVVNTVCSLEKLGIYDHRLEAVMGEMEKLEAL